MISKEIYRAAKITSPATYTIEFIQNYRTLCKSLKNKLGCADAKQVGETDAEERVEGREMSLRDG